MRGRSVGLALAVMVVASLAAAFGAPASPPAEAQAAGPAALPPANMPPGSFTGVSPFRALDTRLSGQGPCVSGSPGRTLKLTGVGGVPDDAAAVALNVTVTQPTGPGFLVVYPTGAAQIPTASNLNFVGGQTVPNMVTVKLGTNGSVTIYANNGCPHVIVDIAGWFKGGSPTTAGGFTGLTPFRALDTRQGGQGPCVSSAGRTLKLTGVGGVPVDAGAVALNVTVTQPAGPGYLAVYPAGEGLPEVSNLNFVAGQTVPNMVTVKLGTNGSVTIYANNGCPHVIVDIAGWYRTGEPAGSGGFTGESPARVLDTREWSYVNGQWVPPACVGPGGRTIQLVERYFPPYTIVPKKAAAVALNVTVTQASGPGYLTVYPAGQGAPTASNLNFVGGEDVPNMVTVKLGTNGSVTIVTNNGCPHVVVDLAGWYNPAPPCLLGAPDGGDQYQFSAVEDGCPLRWQPCATIPWKYNPAGANPSSGGLTAQQVQAAVAAVEAATGLDFVYQGTTTDTSANWKGPGLIIDWRPLNGPLGIAYWSYYPGESRILWSSISLDSQFNLTYPTTSGGWYDVLLHELGHAVGLDHAPDDLQVMYWQYTKVHGEFEDGDLDGLRLVGAEQGCLPEWMLAADAEPVVVSAAEEPATARRRLGP